MSFDNVLQTIGNTPHIRINRLFGTTHKVYVKSERSNPGGSIKDRIALAMVEAAEASGDLKPGATIIEPTSGNTGVGLALVAAVKGYKLILVMPDSMSIERRRLMLAYGASFDLTPREKGMKGAIARAHELAVQTPGAWVPQQFENPANIDVHVRTTAQEILKDFPNGVDYIITGVGTGGHLSGVAKVLKAHWPQPKVFHSKGSIRRYPPEEKTIGTRRLKRQGLQHRPALIRTQRQMRHRISRSPPNLMFFLPTTTDMMIC